MSAAIVSAGPLPVGPVAEPSEGDSRSRYGHKFGEVDAIVGQA